MLKGVNMINYDFSGQFCLFCVEMYKYHWGTGVQLLEVCAIEDIWAVLWKPSTNPLTLDLTSAKLKSVCADVSLART